MTDAQSVRWEVVDTITHDPVRMLIISLTFPNQTQSNLT
jgi:hypothetical protein